MNFFEHIDDYLLGNLSEDQRLAFESELEKDEALRDAIEEAKIAMMVGEAAFEEEIKMEIGDLLDQDIDQDKEKETDKNSWYWIAGLAAMVILVYIVNVVIQRNFNQEPTLYASLYTEPSSWGTQRGESDSIGMALRLIRTGDESAGLQMLQSLGSNNAAYWLAEVYANKALEVSIFSDSTLYYLNFYEPSTNVYRDRTLFLRYISLLNLNRFEKADSVRQAFPEDMDEYYLR